MSVLLELLTECDRCPDWEVRVFSVEEKQRLEAVHTNAKHAATTEAVTGLLTDDPSHAADVETVTAAIEIDGAAHDGQVDPNRVRNLIPSHVQPQVVGATYALLVRQGRLAQVGWTTNADRRGRNHGKPAATYELRVVSA